MYRWHSVVEAQLGASTRAVVVSEDPWNLWTRSPVVIPVVDRVRANLLRPSIGSAVVADCTRPITVNQSRLGAEQSFLTPGESQAVIAGLRSILNVNHFLAGTIPPGPGAPVTGWYPRFGHIYHDTLPIDTEEKMFVILTDDLWNASKPFVVGLRLTSRSKPRRQRWEVPLSGGPVIVGDIHLIPPGRLSRTPPRPPRPLACTPVQATAIGRGLTALLRL